MITRVFFIYQMSLEQKANEFFLKYLKNYSCSKHLIVMDSNRIFTKNKKNDFDNIIILKKIHYSKNILKTYNGKIKIINRFKNLSIRENDLLISPPLFDISNIVVYDLFRRKKAKSLIYSFNGVTPYSNNFKFNLKKTIIYSFNSLFLNKKITRVFNIKDTPYKFPFMKVNTDYFIDFGVSNSYKKYINSKYFFKIPNLDYNIKSSNEILILINTNKIYALTGLSKNEYFKKIKSLIEKFKDKYEVRIKDHPSSKFPTESIIENLNIVSKNIIYKQVSFENYLDKTCPKLILSLGSSTLLYARLLGINCFSIDSYLNSRNPDRYSRVYGIDIFREDLKVSSNKEKIQSHKLNEIVDLIMN